jgi:hypothetical protein
MKREKCKTCGYKIRGKKHVEGQHHLDAINKGKQKPDRKAADAKP